MNLSKMQESASKQNQLVLNDNTGPMTPETPASFHPLSMGQQVLWFLYQMAPESVTAWHRALQKKILTRQCADEWTSMLF